MLLTIFAEKWIFAADSRSMRFKKYIPVLEWLPAYSKNDFKGDLSAGLTVGVMLIPQGMAYAMLAGLPPIYGLYAATVPLVLYAIFGTSRQLAVGPVAMVSLLVAGGVGILAEAGSAQYIQLAIVLALLVGIIQFFLGVLRLGFLVNFLSHPVISGFTSAAALIIGLNQLKHLLGIDIPRDNHIHTILLKAFENIEFINIPTLIIGVVGITTILLLKKLHKMIPGQLITVIAGIIIVQVFGLQNAGVKIIQDVPGGFPAFTLPAFTVSDIGRLFPTALTIALVGFMESIAVAKAVQAKHRNYKIDPNQELIGLGLANIGGAFFKAFPTTGGFSRTAVNDQSGASTGMASIFSALLVIITLLFLTPLFYYLPNAVLAAVIMVAVFGLIDFGEIIHLWKTDRMDFTMLVVTFLGTLLLGVEKGIGLGVLLSLGLVLYRSSYPHTAVLGRIPGTDNYRNIYRFPEAEQRNNILIYRFDAELFFGNSKFFRNQIEDKLLENRDLKLVIINAEAINGVDSTSIRMLKELHENLRSGNIEIVFAGVKGPVRDIISKTKLADIIGKELFFDTIQDAVDWYDSDRKTGRSHFQVNSS